MLGTAGAILIGAAVWILSQPAGAATVGEVRGIAGLCGLMVGAGFSMIAVELVGLAQRS